eukprot:Rhum_TRINITY_DN8527_c0_g1::Rhum_TRINITY_DN8527_c0_g1_i2::g.28574::m.28574
MLRRSTLLFAAASPHAVLGVSETASKKELRAAFVALAKKYHPDVNPEGKEKFQQVQEAYVQARKGLGRAGASADAAAGPGTRAASEQAEEEDQRQEERRTDYGDAVRRRRQEAHGMIARLPAFMRPAAVAVRNALVSYFEAVAIVLVAGLVGFVYFVFVECVVSRAQRHYFQEVGALMGLQTARIQKYLTTGWTTQEKEIDRREKAMQRVMDSSISEEIKEMEEEDRALRAELLRRGLATTQLPAEAEEGGDAELVAAVEEQEQWPVLRKTPSSRSLGY